MPCAAARTGPTSKNELASALHDNITPKHILPSRKVAQVQQEPRGSLFYPSLIYSNNGKPIQIRLDFKLFFYFLFPTMEGR
jgi:hypothetical protein